MKHRIAALAAALCIVAVSAVPAVAGRAEQQAAPQVAAGVETECSGNPIGVMSGQESSTSSPSQTRSGVLAYIDISDTGFDICNNYVRNSGPSAWVAIQPKVPQTNLPYEEIIQLGVIECGGGWYLSYCQGENNPHYVYAYGPCAGSTIKDLGPATLGLHVFSIYLDYDNRWHFSIDGSEKASISRGFTSCWDTTLRKAVWGFERFNEGDSMGESGVKTVVTQARYGIYGQGWFDPLFFGGPGNTLPCQKLAKDDSCIVSNGDEIRVYTKY